MSLPVCPACGRELGPWEASTCLTHLPSLREGSGFRRPPPHWSIADLAVAALEGESGPVAIHDVQRVVARDLGRLVHAPTMNALVGTDRRFCWAGKGVYGLFRHDLLPSVRTLSGLARFVLASYGGPITLSDLSFVLKWSGYRFQDVSLQGALLRDAANVGIRFSYSPSSFERTVRILAARDERRAIIRELAIPDPANGTWPATLLTERWRERVASGLEERQRRLDAAERSVTSAAVE